MTNPNRKGLKGLFLNFLEDRGYLLLNQRKLELRNTWLRSLNIRTVLDVGANTGESALEFHRLVPQAKVVSFEPLADSYASMQQRLQGHESWWRGFNMALGERAGKQTIHRSDYSLSSSLLPMADAHKEAFPYTAGSREEQIEVGVLDEVIKSNKIEGPFLLKLDVQGFEVQVLSGAEKTLANCSAIICETSFVELYQGQRLFSEVAHLLEASGFGYAGSWAQRNSPLDGRPLQQDAIFLKK